MTDYQALTALSAIINIALAVYSFRMRKVKSAMLFSVLMLFMVVFAAASFFELTAGNIQGAILWRNICQIGYLLALPTLLVFVFDYTGKSSFLKPGFILLIYVFPIFGIVLRWTDQYTHLMRKDISFSDGRLIITSTFFAQIVIFLELSIAIAAAIILVAFCEKANRQYRKQLLSMSAGILIPVVIETIKAADPQISGVLPPMSVTFTVTGIITFWSIFRHKLFTIVPVARDRIMESIREGIIIVDDFGRVVDKNNAIDEFIVDVTGSRHDIMGKTAGVLLGDWPQWLSACRDMEDATFEIETSAWGNKRFYRVKVYPLSEKGFKKRGTVSILFDITGDKHRENKLASTLAMNNVQIKEQAEKISENEKQLEAVFENMSDHCVVVDKTGSYIRVNKAAKEFIPGLKVEKVGDFLKKAVYFDAEGKKLEKSDIPAVKVINGEKFTNYRIVVETGGYETHFDVNGTPVYDNDGNFLFGVVCSHDVTEYIKLGKNIERKWVEFQTIFENMRDVIHVVDRNGSFIYSNKAAREYFSNIKIENPGDSYVFVKYYNMNDEEIPAENSPVRRALRGEHVIAERTKIVYADRIRYNNVTCIPVCEENGEIEYVVLSAREITEIVEKEKTIERQHKLLLKAEIDKNAALQKIIENMNELEQLEELNSIKDQLLTVVSHDIRNPIATMVTLIDLLDGETDCRADDYREIITSVKEQVNNTYNIVEGLLDWLKSQREGFVYILSVWDLCGIVTEAASLFGVNARAKDIRLVNEIAEGLKVIADKEMLTSVLRNLISNSIKFTSRGGIISIHAFQSGKEITVAVSDTGMGIEHEKAETLFSSKRVYTKTGTTGEKGTGLGLLICKEFVTRYGGRIWAESTPGEGSTVYFTLFSATPAEVADYENKH